MKKRESNDHIKKWFEKTNWAKRPKAICKPCWEIKYCPYGPLVEDFPVGKAGDEKTCRIFGHQCPVFFVAEPFTETKDLRNISRQIPRATQFRVLKRENQVCGNCGKPVKDEDIEFDHIIPWSKGGSSDESNIRLLCKACNRKRGKKYEEHYLVKDVNEHISEPSSESIIKFLLLAVSIGHEFKSENGQFPTAKDYSDNLTQGETTVAEAAAANYFKDLSTFFTNKRPTELSGEQFEILKFRWGFKDGVVHRIIDLTEYYTINEDEYLEAEKNLIRRLGIVMSEAKGVISKWKKL